MYLNRSFEKANFYVSFFDFLFLSPEKLLKKTDLSLSIDTKRQVIPDERFSQQQTAWKGPVGFFKMFLQPANHLDKQDSQQEMSIIVVCSSTASEDLHLHGEVLLSAMSFCQDCVRPCMLLA